jgi:glycosyltransferase involved in cell wall biosynthesis
VTQYPVSDSSDTLNGDSKFPLFVTRYGLSDRTAIGVQTKHLISSFSTYAHLYWHESPFDPAFPHSHRIESWLFGRFHLFKHDNVPSRLLRMLNASLWHGDKPSPALTAFLRTLKQHISILYLAPIEAADARRMKEIALELQLPFVLHFWDFLDSNVTDAATKWLIENATHIFCLNYQMLKDMHGVQRKSSILTFTRGPSNMIARYTSGNERIIALTGNITSYIDGMKCLIRAVDILRAAGKDYRIVYIGPLKSVRRCGIGTHDFITATGFLPSAEERDNVLAECAVGFMPGPTAAPEADARSKYSIPSRILDYLAVGLPIVGSIHPRSATYSFCRDLGIDVGLLLDNPQRVAQSLVSLENEWKWITTNRRNLSAFSEFVDAHNVDELKTVLNHETCPLGNPRSLPQQWH